MAHNDQIPMHDAALIQGSVNYAAALSDYPDKGSVGAAEFEDTARLWRWQCSSSRTGFAQRSMW